MTFQLGWTPPSFLLRMLCSSLSVCRPSPVPSPLPPYARFALTSDAPLEEAKVTAISKNTAKRTSWCVNIWKEWSQHRQSLHPGAYSEWPIHLYLADSQQLDYWLSKFVLETWKRDGDHYPPKTLYAICCGLQRYIQDHRPDINLFSSPLFAGFRKVLDGEMKRLRSTGLGVSVKQAEPITVDEENQLWEKGVLGDHSPQSLVDTMLFLCDVKFALRSGEEHRSLQVSQFTLTHCANGSLQLEYTENYSKNNAGGLAHRKVQPKHVVHHANDAYPKRCLVRLYQTYMSYQPSVAKSNAFYLTPLKKPKGNVWYGKTPIGHNTLNTTVSRICKAAVITGFKTNHSLRVTTATRLFQKGVEEQLIMSRTGHRSVEGVQTYKRIGDDQQTFSMKPPMQKKHLPLRE